MKAGDLVCLTQSYGEEKDLRYRPGLVIDVSLGGESAYISWPGLQTESWSTLCLEYVNDQYNENAQ